MDEPSMASRRVTEQQDLQSELPLLGSVQATLEHSYDVKLSCPVDEFVSHDAHWLEGITGAPADTDEVLLLRQQDDSLDMTLYLNEAVLPRAGAALQSGQLDSDGLDAVCTVVEGVSHVVCVLWHAQHDRQIRALDLELQADVDKFVLLARTQNDAEGRGRLHQHLFEQMQITHHQDSSLHERYRVAHQQAASYCGWLNDQYMNTHDERGLNNELARFYRLSGSDKHHRIRHLH